jgi:hypothetical protein
MKPRWRRAARLGALGVALFLGSEAGAIIGMPWTPLSFAGAARRTVRRTAWVGPAAAGAAVGTAAAIGTAAAAGTAAARSVLPVGCVAYQPCGGIVYQPVYQGPTVVYVPQ